MKPSHHLAAGLTCQWDTQVASFLKACYGDQLPALQQAICSPAPQCVRVNTLKGSAQEVLDHITKANSSTNTGPNTCGSSVRVHPKVPMAIILPGDGPLDVDYSLAEGHEVIISRKAGEAVLKGAPVYAPGVLACSKGVSQGQLVAVTVAVEQLGGNVRGIARGTTLSTDCPPPHDSQGTQAQPDQQGESRPHLAAEQGGAGHRYVRVGVGRARMSRTEMFRVEHGLAISMEYPLYKMPSVSGLDGKVMRQGLPSIVAALALSPPPGSRVLDMCASPGGKTTVIAQLMGNKGEIIALDRTHVKAAQILRLAAELGATCVKAYRMDATKAVFKQPPGSGPDDNTGGVNTGGEAAAAAGPTLTPTAVGGSEKVAARQARKQAARLVRGLTAQPVRKRAFMPPPPLAASQQEQPGPYQPSEQAAASTQQDHLHSSGAAHVATPEQAVHQGDAGVEGCGGSLDEQVQVDHQGATSPPPPPPLVGAPGGGAGSGGGVVDDAGGGMAVEYDTTPPAPGFAPESFDAVLLDAPCSALGLRPRWVQTATLPYLKQCGLYSRKLLDVAVQLLKPGGRLVFSTCTINPLENEANVRHVIDKYPGVMQLIKATPCVGGPGLTGWATPQGPAGDRGFDMAGMEGMWLTQPEAELVQRFEPFGSQNTNGFFIAAFTKVASQADV